MQSSRTVHQTIALSKKNLLLASRNLGSTGAQLCVGVGLLILMLILKTALVLSSSGDNVYSYFPYAYPEPGNTFLPCVPSVITGRCYSFAYANAWGTGNSTLTEQIIDQVATLLQIDATRNVSGGILAFPPTSTAADVDSWILANPNSTRTVILFENTNTWTSPNALLRYTVAMNNTQDCQTLVFDCTNPMLEYHTPLKTALDAVIISILNGTIAPPNISASYSNFPHPDLPASFDVMQQYGSLFFYVALTFLWVIQLQTMVQEREDHLVESMRQMGMRASAYWISWFVVALVIDTLCVFLLLLVGYICQFDLFVKTDGQLLLTFFWLTALSFSSMAFLFSTLTRYTSTARVIGAGSFLIFFIAAPLLTQIYFGDPDQAYDKIRIVISLIPIISYFNIVQLLISGSSGSTAKGLSWSDVNTNILPPSATNTYVTFWSIGLSLDWLVYTFIIYTLLAIYLDNVIPSEYGRAKSPWYFLTRSYWGLAPPAAVAKVTDIKPDLAESVDQDVRAEALAVVKSDFGSKPPAVVVRGLTKQFGWRNKFTAVDNVWYSIPEGELFALLGHNGSGKSTTFNALTGLTNVSSGDAEIFGKSIRGDMAELHAHMGVCPQHDILWKQLTAREHLEMFATIKGFANVKDEAEKRIEQTKLQSAADKLVGGFSGGMRRRLSIAIAMLGDPKIVFLDEPTTGMDPVTRSEVLQMIANAKQGRVIVLTSHAMEEVEFLADKVAVMSHGKIQAVGTTLRLKKRFGAGFRLSMIVSNKTDMPAVLTFMQSQAPAGSICTSSVETSLQYQLPRTEESSVLVDFFRRFEASRKSLNVTDYSLGLSTLEEVFLNLSHSAEEGLERIGEAIPKYRTVQTTRRVTLATQWKALCLKSCTFQIRNCWGCCCVVTFPVLIMVAMIVLQTIIFTPLKILAVCGPNVSQANCLSQGYNLTCVAAQYEYSPFIQVDSVTVGQIDLTGGPRGSGLNVNCDSVTCYYGLEKMDVRNFPVYGLGNATLSGPQIQAMFEWYSDLLFLLGNSTCQDDFSNALTASTACQPGPTFSECSANVTKLIIADQYENAISKTGDTLDACLPNPQGLLTAPDNYTLEVLANLNNILQSCLINQTTGPVTAHFTTLNISQALSSSTWQVTHPGLVDTLRMTDLQDPLLNTFRNFLWTTTRSIGPQLSNYNTLIQTWYANNGLNPSDISYTPTLAQMCSNIYDGVSKPFPLQYIVTNPTALTNLCAFAVNSDLVRGFAPLDYDTEAALDMSFVDSWFGFLESTSLMQNLSVNLPSDHVYLERFFFTRFSGLRFDPVTAANTYSYLMYYNSTATNGNDDVNWPAMLAVVQSAIVRHNLPLVADMQTRYKQMPVAFQCNRDAWLEGATPNLHCDLITGFLQYSILDFVAAQLFPFIFLLLVYLIVNLVVHEKEHRLRIIMKINGGLRDSVYWSVTYVFFMVQFIIMCLFIYITGRIANINFVSLHDPGVYWLFVFSWAQTLVAFSFLLSVFFNSTRTSTAVVFLLILIFGLVGINLISSIILDPSSTDANYASLMWLPPFAMIRYVLWLAIAGGLYDKISFSALSTFADGSLAKCIGIMWGETFACLILVWYLDQVWVGGVGVQRPPLFFLDRDYWYGAKGKENEDELGSIPLPPNVVLLTSGGADIQAEYERVVKGSDDKLAVRVIRLHKRFESGFVAVKSISLGINKNECFGWLGHNGAGKTTAINMLVGLFEPTSGTALVDGLSIRTQMDEVQAKMGVCPQHDLTWGQLTCREHLLFYARLKGVPSDQVTEAVDSALIDVNLKKFEHRKAAALSGGMRRRLSVAMALIGSPVVVYMDEPSTGLDPASKRALWDVISRAKGEKSIVLTTHSMEECEVLCDRLCIQSLGELQAIGTSTELKARYGKGYTFSLNTSRDTPAAVVSKFASELFPSCVELKMVMGSYRFEVPRNAVILSAVFEKMESPATKEALQLVDWSLQETTLEEVFLKLADEAHVEQTLSAEDPRGVDETESVFCCLRRTKSRVVGEHETQNLQVVGAEKV